MITKHVMARAMVLLAACGSIFLSPRSSSAVTIAEYTFGTTGSETFSATTTSAGVSAGDITNVVLGTFSVTGLGYSTAPVLNVDAGSGATTDVDLSFMNDNFFTFTITPDAGQALNLGMLTFDVARGGAGTPRSYGVRSDLTGTTNLGSGEVGTVRPTFSPISIDLSTFANLQNVQQAVTLQFAVAAASGSLEFDTISLSGDVITAVLPPAIIPVALVEYNFDGNSLAATNTLPDMSASSISFGSMPTSFNTSYATTPSLQVNPPATNESGAVAGDDYFEFTISPTGGKILDLDSLVFDAARGGNSGPREWFLYSDIDGFALGSAIDGEEILTNRSVFTRFTVDLSDARFQNLMGPVTFRMYVTTNSTNSLEFDNIDVVGTLRSAVPVPEPMTTGLLVLAGAALLRRRRLA